jgi:hypothetical protein
MIADIGLKVKRALFEANQTNQNKSQANPVQSNCMNRIQSVVEDILRIVVIEKSPAATYP